MLLYWACDARPFSLRQRFRAQFSNQEKLDHGIYSRVDNAPWKLCRVPQQAIRHGCHLTMRKIFWRGHMNDMRRLQAGHQMAAIALRVAVCMIVLSIPTFSAKTSNLDAFAQCVAAKQATMYGSFSCTHCDDQKKLFGASFKYVRYVECSVPGSRQMAFACEAQQIRFTPTWIFADAERLIGVQSLQQLSIKTGCSLP